jgi:TPR repeat protein
MRMRWKLIALTMTLAAAMLSADAQTAGIDAALASKANRDDAAAQVAVGEHYAASAAGLHSAIEAGKAYKQAAEWYRKAADQRSIAGEMHLAALYRDGGKGFPRDMEQAVVWYQKAAEQGDVTAQGTLGVLYSIGQGVEKNDVEAYFWLDVAAEVKGPKQAQYAQNRQMIGTHITTDELEEVLERVAKWLAAHPRPAAAE